MTDEPAMTIENMAVEAAGIILHAAGSSLRNYTPHAKDEILACTRHALSEAYARGRRDMGEEAARLCDELSRDDCSARYAASEIRALIEKELTK